MLAWFRHRQRPPGQWPALPPSWRALLTQWDNEGALPETPWHDRLAALLQTPGAAEWMVAAEPGDSGVRAELFKGPHGLTLVGRRWAPDESTPIHDHGGAGGAEVVLCGALRLQTYRLQDDWLMACEAALAMTGAIVPLAPGLIHEAANLLVNQPSVSLHLYGPSVHPSRVYPREAPLSGHWRA